MTPLSFRYNAAKNGASPTAIPSCWCSAPTDHPGGHRTMGLVALCPGTFDPVTNGHLDIIQRAARCFDEVVVAVLENPGKQPLFGVDERVAMLKEALAETDHASVESFSGLLVDYARSRGSAIVVKGLRAMTDFDYELQMAQMNSRMAGVETFFVATSP